LIFELLKDDGNDLKIKDLISKIKDFDKFLSFLTQNGLDTCIYQKIKEYQIILNKDFLKELKYTYLHIVKTNMLLTVELKLLSELFTKNDISHLSFKGPLLSMLSYGDIISRRYLDLDILVKKDDLTKIYKLLENNGYTCDIDIDYAKDERFLDLSKDLIFYHKKKNIVIEIHWKLFEKRFFFQNISLNDLAWQNSQEIKLNDFSILTFDKEYLVFYLIIHGSKHFWERIEWLYNIYLILIKYDIDLNKIIDYSKAMKTETMVNIFFILIQKRFNYKIDQKLIKLNKKSYKVAENIEKNWLILDEREGMNLKEIKFMISMQDDFLNKLKVIYKTVFQIKVYDILYINLDKRLTFMYYFIRPFRFIKDHFIKK
jgi:hypothetical protein